MDLQRDILPLKNRLYRLALRLTPGSQEAEDVVQDVIIRLWQRGDALDDVENLEAYALRMTRNLAIDRSRLHVNRMETIDETHDGADAAYSSDPSRSLETTERIEQIRTVMQHLPEKQRTAMHLRDFEGHTYQEIAEIMEISEAQVKVCIHRARQAVREFMLSHSAQM